MERKSESSEGVDTELHAPEIPATVDDGVGDPSEEEVFETAPERLPRDSNNTSGKGENHIPIGEVVTVDEKSGDCEPDVDEEDGGNVTDEGVGIADKVSADNNGQIEVVVENVDGIPSDNGVAKEIEVRANEKSGEEVIDGGEGDGGNVTDEVVGIADKVSADNNGQIEVVVENVDGVPSDNGVAKEIEVRANVADEFELKTEATGIVSNGTSNTSIKNGVSGDDGSIVNSEEFVELGDGDLPVKEKVKDVDSLQIVDGERAPGAVDENDDDEVEDGEDDEEELQPGSGVAAETAIDGQVVTDSEDSDDEGESKELFDSAALAALLKSAAESGGDAIGSNVFSIERPAGLGSSTLRSFKPAAQPTRTTLFNSLTSGGSSQDNAITEEEKKKLENLQNLRIKFLRLVQRLGHSSEEATISQVLYRLSLIAGRQTNPLFNLDAAKASAMEMETSKSDLDFSLNILVLGKSGVGKSATVNSIFGEEKSQIHAYEPATSSVQELSGDLDGVKIKIIDCPGLKSSGSEQGTNRRILSSVKKLTKKSPPDILLYVDRLDSQTRDLNDMPVLRAVTDTLGSSIWRSAIVGLTHAASAPPDGPSGTPMSYEVFVAQRSHVVQQLIGQACGDLRLMNPTLMNPVALVENHPSCRKNREGQKVLPNGQTWRSQLLLLCYSMKILSEANSLTKPELLFNHKKLFSFRARSPPLPYLLSWQLQSRAHPKNASDEGDVDSDVDHADFSDSEEENDEDYDQLPPFKPLRKKQIEKLTREQKVAYFEEYDYRVKLLQKKQWREELKSVKDAKRKRKVNAEDVFGGVEPDPAPAAVPVPLPDMILPPSFDGDNPCYRYRFLEPNSQFLARPVLDNHGWDHDCGYDGVNIEQGLAIANRFPASIAVQVTKDKKDFNLHLDSSLSAKHGDNVSSMAGFDIQNVGKQLAYIIRGETKLKNHKRNKTGAGFTLTFLGQNIATGVKVEDQISVGKRWTLMGSTGTVRSKGDSAYGANLEVRLKDRDFPIVQDQSSLGLSLVKWRGDLASGANLQSQVSLGQSSKVAIRAGLNNKLSGQLTVKTSSSDHLQIALIGLLPIIMSIYKAVRPGSEAADTYQIY